MAPSLQKIKGPGRCFVSLAIFALHIMAWQIFMIKQVYQTSTRKSVILYVLPIFFIISIVVFVALIGAAFFSFYD